jgi:hypothetical protein
MEGGEAEEEEEEEEEVVVVGTAAKTPTTTIMTTTMTLMSTRVKKRNQRASLATANRERLGGSFIPFSRCLELALSPPSSPLLFGVFAVSLVD